MDGRVGSCELGRPFIVCAHAFVNLSDALMALEGRLEGIKLRVVTFPRLSWKILPCLCQHLALEAQPGRYAFESCLTLTSITFVTDHTNKPRALPEGAFCGAGIEQLCLPGDFHNIGPRACENCKGLVEVNFMCTEITALLHSTFAHCVALNCIWLPPRLTQIGKEVFLNSVALQEVVRDKGIRAFCGLQRFTPPAFLMCNNLKDHCGWSCSPLKDPIRMSLTKSQMTNFPNIGPVHAGVMVRL